jgi:membrane-bound lytic murein transglycosylase D
LALNRFQQHLTRIRARVAFPVLGVAMGLATIVTGLERTSFIGGAAGVEQVASASVGSSTVSSIDGLIAGPNLSSTVSSTVRTIAQDLGTLSGAAAATTSAPTLDNGVAHPRIDKWVTRLTTSLRGDFKQSLQRMAKYEDMITAKIDAKGMPRDLIYLALIESNFNPAAKSPVSAVGLWQFMSGTAKQFGLSVGRGVDERKDPAKSTDAALAYLGKLHNEFGSWYLAAAAYNSGQGTVSKALRSVTGKTTGTDADFFRIMPKLPKETQDYVPKLLASARVGSDPGKYGF